MTQWPPGRSERGKTVTLKTRKPTGAVPWPLILIEGEEKAGKTWACAQFTASDKVGRSFWIDMGEGAADEYGAIPGASYEVVEHDGSWADLYANVAEIHELAGKALADGGKPVVLIIDTMTSEWDLLKDWAADRAKTSKSNRAKLERDPNAEVTITGNLWNDANARHKKLMKLLKTFPGIALITAHGKQTAVIGADGQPVEGKKTHKVEAQKSLGADASCWLRLFREEPGIIVGGRSVHLQFRPGDKPRELAADWTLEGIIFGALGCDAATAHVRELAEPKREALSPENIRDEALHPNCTFDRIRELHAEVRRLGYDDVVLINGHGDDERLLTMLEHIGNDLLGGAAGHVKPRVSQQPAQRPAAQPAPPTAVPGRAADGDAEDQWVAKFNIALDNSTNLDSLNERAKDVRAARREGVISVEVTNELLDQVAAAKRSATVAA